MLKKKENAEKITIYDILKGISYCGNTLIGLYFINWGVQLYDSGQYLPLVYDYPEAASLFILVMFGILMMK